MNKTLHIVSCITVTNVMKQAELSGDFLEWQDFLHVGPTPENFSLQQLSKIRAHFLNDHKYTPLEQALKLFSDRNHSLENHQKYKKIILWFEKDLYDQLQLLQILDWFETHLSKGTELTLVLTNRHFAEYSFQEFQRAMLYEETITKKHLQLSKKIWSAFSDTTPLSWFKLLTEPTIDLLSLKNTALRLLEEYPNTTNGLSRTEHQALLSISNTQERQKQDIFIASQKQEQKPFIADVIFWKILDNFIAYKLIIEEDNHLYITDLGKDVLDGKKNWISIKNIDHWIGGVHLSNDNLWCWDIKEKTIKKYYYSMALSSLIPIRNSIKK